MPENSIVVEAAGRRLRVRRIIDLTAWMEAQPRGALSQAIREMLRRGLEIEGHARQQPHDYEYIRQIVADELASALSGLHWHAPLIDEALDASDIESQFGTKLDRMMGGLAANSGTGIE